ncbi:MAG: threonylcarbamoyl-AMP synthase [Magnetococcales bacterium]|nr:threonylcarbamoyl-AMP synthase [Magnetococcales bacterium]
MKKSAKKSALNPGNDSLSHSSNDIEKAVAVLQSGGVIAHPTETIFGLGVAANNSKALDKLLEIKSRSKAKGFIVLIPDRTFLFDMVQATSLNSSLVQALMAKFWPGPLTLVLPALPEVSPRLTGGGGFIATRHSSSPLVAELLAAYGGAVVSTSANRSGGPALLDHHGVKKELGSELGCIIPGSSSESSLASTVLMVEEKLNKVSLLRSGAVPIADIKAALQVVDPLVDLVVHHGAETPPQ